MRVLHASERILARRGIVNMGKTFVQRLLVLSKAMSPLSRTGSINQAIAVTAHHRFVSRQFELQGIRTAWWRPLLNNRTRRISGTVASGCAGRVC